MKLVWTTTFNEEILAQYCSLIEQLILSANETAAASGIRLTDSAVKSALVKAVNSLRGRLPRETASSPKDRLLADLSGVILGLRQQIEAVAPGDETKPAIRPDTNEWAQTINALIHSIERRMSGEAGGRNYLEFLPEFFKGIPRSVTFPGAPVSGDQPAA
ncbi:MAG TPA: hypothetical protein VG796_13000 [Verrucomicrobiales bacterium]|nr:hypothetical protein [Verrucomicrobiales bacterium]